MLPSRGEVGMFVWVVVGVSVIVFRLIDRIRGGNEAKEAHRQSMEW
jgi:hypothetical protein